MWIYELFYACVRLQAGDAGVNILIALEVQLGQYDSPGGASLCDRNKRKVDQVSLNFHSLLM